VKGFVFHRCHEGQNEPGRLWFLSFIGTMKDKTGRIDLCFAFPPVRCILNLNPFTLPPAFPFSGFGAKSIEAPADSR